MKLTIEQPELSAALATTRSIVKTTNTIPVLGNVLLSASDMGLYIAATDTCMSVEVNTECNVEQPGTTTVSAIKFFEIVRKLSNARPINIELDGTALTIKQGRSRFKLETLDAGQFPSQIKVDNPVSLNIPASNIQRVISKTIHASGTEEARHMLMGIYMHHTVDGKLNAAATDSHRLAHVADIEVAPFDGFILPSEAAKTIAKNLDHVSGDVNINIGKNSLSVDTGHATIYTKYIDGTFPPYERIIPDNDLVAKTGKEELLSAINRVCVLADGKNRRVRLDFHDNVIDVVSVGMGQEEAVDQIDCEFSGKTSIAFNSKYLSDTLAQLDDGIVNLALGNSEMSPCVIKQDGVDNETFVVMPMKG